LGLDGGPVLVVLDRLHADLGVKIVPHVRKDSLHEVLGVPGALDALNDVPPDGAVGPLMQILPAAPFSSVRRSPSPITPHH
jgi:hypothetical protein